MTTADPGSGGSRRGQRRRAAALLAVCVLALTPTACTNARTPAARPAPTEAVAPPPGTIFEDFDGPAGAPPQPGLWGYDVGPYQDAGLQTYTSAPENVRLDGQGHLLIQATRTPSGFDSARPVTRGKLSMLYGKLTARIKFPKGQGIWPAFWLLGADYETAGWPACGEIDLMELVNVGTQYHVSLHGPQGATDYYGGVEVNGRVVGTQGPIADLTDDFHDYWLDWKPNRVIIGVDSTTLGDFTPAALPPGAQWMFNRPMYALLNIAVGGAWPGPPNDQTPFPATMSVDWLRYTPLYQ